LRNFLVIINTLDLVDGSWIFKSPEENV